MLLTVISTVPNGKNIMQYTTVKVITYSLNHTNERKIFIYIVHIWWRRHLHLFSNIRMTWQMTCTSGTTQWQAHLVVWSQHSSSRIEKDRAEFVFYMFPAIMASILSGVEILYFMSCSPGVAAGRPGVCCSKCPQARFCIPTCTQQSKSVLWIMYLYLLTMGL